MNCGIFRNKKDIGELQQISQSVTKIVPFKRLREQLISFSDQQKFFYEQSTLSSINEDLFVLNVYQKC